MTSLRVFYVHQYFKTPAEGSSSRSWYFTNALVEAGHHPVVITTHNHSRYEKKKIRGVEIHYLPISYDNSYSFIKRVKAFMLFVKGAIRLSGKIPPADIAYVLSTPLTTGLVALYLKKFRKTPYIFDVADLWPRAPIEIGAIRNGIVKKLLYRLEGKIYQEAKTVVALSPAIKSDIRARFPNVPVALIPNMSDVGFFSSMNKTADLESAYGTKGKFVVTYFGAAGVANHLFFLLDAAERSQEMLQSVVFIVVAEGSELHRIKSEAKARKLKNLTFLPYMPKHKLKEVLAVTDAVYISFKDLPVLETGSPNKFFDGLAAGKIIITNFGGWVSDLVKDVGIGFQYDPHMPEEFVVRLQPYLTNKALRETSSARALNLGKQQFSRKEHTAAFVRLIEGAI